MSLTVSPGFQSADRWVGNSASMAEYLEDYRSGKKSRSKIPKGTFKGAEQFFECVKYGLALDHREQPEEYSHLPLMARNFMSFNCNKCIRKNPSRIIKTKNGNWTKKYRS